MTSPVGEPAGPARFSTPVDHAIMRCRNRFRIPHPGGSRSGSGVSGAARDRSLPTAQGGSVVPQHPPHGPGVFFGDVEDGLQIALPKEVVNPAFDGEKIGRVLIRPDRCGARVKEQPQVPEIYFFFCFSSFSMISAMISSGLLSLVS